MWVNGFMDFLLHNIIADMPGPVFIWVAVAYCVLVIVVIRVWGILGDSTRELPTPPIETNPDPYEIAYLRDGAYGVAVTILFNLLQQGFLTKWGNEICLSKDKTDMGRLSDLERVIYSEFKTSQRVDRVLHRKQVLQSVDAQCSRYQQQLIPKKLLSPPPSTFHALPSLLMLETPLIYKLLVAFAKGKHNVGFLILLIIVAPFILSNVCKPIRITALGKKYMTQLQDALLDLKHKVGEDGAQAEAALMVGLFGAGILIGSSYGFLHSLLPSIAPGSGGAYYGASGCSSSCGSSCGGGGCGGCGGCGS